MCPHVAGDRITQSPLVTWKSVHSYLIFLCHENLGSSLEPDLGFVLLSLNRGRVLSVVISSLGPHDHGLLTLCCILLKKNLFFSEIHNKIVLSLFSITTDEGFCISFFSFKDPN